MFVFHRGSRRTSPHSFLMLLALALMLLAPLGDQIAMAQDDEAPPAEEAEQPPPEEPTEAPPPVEDDPAEVTVVPPEIPEDPTAVPTEVVATEQPAPETHRLTIAVYRCDHPEFDPYFSENIQMVFDQCTGPGSGTFTAIIPRAELTQSGSALEFEIFGDLFIVETLQPGYDDAIANCFLYDLDGNLVDQIGPGDTSGGAWKVGAIRGDVHCDWYQVDRGVGNVYVVNMACPNALGFPVPTMDELVAMCTAPAGQKQFFVTHGAGLERMGVSGGEFNDVLFEAIQTGAIEIRMDDPGAFESARAFCQVNTLDGVEISPFAEVAVSDFRATGFTLGHGQRLHCAWFNIPQGPGLALPEDAPAPTPTQELVLELPDDEPVATQPPAGNLSELTIRKHTCPAGYDPEAAGANPNLDCPPGPNGVNFTLTDADPNTVDLQTMTGDSIDNAVTFGGLNPGDYTATETVPGGTAVIFVLGCGGGGGIDPIPVFIDGALAINLQPGVIRTCPWFNIPEVGSQQGIAREGTPGVVAALVGTASLTMYKYTCPAGFDVTAIDANPQGSCTPTDGVSFEMDDTIDDNGGWMFETGVTGPGYSTIDGLAADTYSVHESVDNGITATFVWDCYDAAGSSSRTDPLMMGDQLIYGLADGAQIRCDWFNVSGGTARVIINKHACDVLIDAYTLSREELATQCTADPGTVNFTVVSGTHQETLPASKTPLVLASFANIPTGYMAVVEDLPAGWSDPVVFCEVNLEDASNVSPPAAMEVLQGRQISFALDPGQVMYCDWYNVTAGFVDIHVTKYACPAGFDPYAADLTTLVVTCTADPGIIEFTTEDGGLYLQTRTTTATTTADFIDVPSGQLRISENLPAGYGLPVVFCRIDFEDGSNVTPSAPATVENGPSISRSLSAGQVLFCEWFNAPGGLGMVSIWKQACPAGFDAYSATHHELETYCGEDIETIDFTLTSGSFSQTSSSTNLFRYADFPGVPTGAVTVTESPPGGYGEPVVYCRVQETGQPVTPEEKMAVGGDASIAWPLEPNQWLICDWYNVPETDSTVTILKFECPEGTASDEDDAWYGTNCTQPHDGIDFKLTHSGGASTMTTAGGQAQWADIPLGPFSIQEYIPPEYGEPVVFCFAGSAVSLAQLVRVEAPGGYLEAELTVPRTFYTCHWYNIPGGPGEITIHKYTCPEGYDLHAHGADPLSDCATKTNDVTFTLAGAAAQLQATTSNGMVTFGELAPGDYTATESVPPDTRYVFVLDCYGGKLGAIRPYPLAMGETLTIAVGAGESIVCHWFNVPEYEEGRLTVVKFQCSTTAYISDVDCEIYEDGQTFDLVFWNGEAWEYHSTGTTDGAGQYTWVDLTPGEYWLDEHDRDWLHLASEQISDDGNWLNVAANDETVVTVYNGSSDPGDQGKPGEIPTKYPNTGLPPGTPEPGRETP